MPIIEIEIVNKIGESFPPDLAANLADEMGKVFASPLGGDLGAAAFSAAAAVWRK